MIKAQDIIAQLQTSLPNKTNLFSSPDLIITSLTCSGTTVTAVCSTQHKLKNGGAATILNAQTPVVISGITYVNQPFNNGAIVTVKTATDHDYTQGFGYTATIVNPNFPDIQGTFPILTVPDRKTFTFKINVQPSYIIGSFGTLLQTIPFGYNGRYIITVIDPYTFTYNVPSTVASPAQGSPVARTGIRVSGACSLERAVASYTPQPANNLWAFVVLNDNTISKDRNVTTDATITLARGDEYRIRAISSFSIYVFVPSTDATDVAGRSPRDTIEDVRLPLFQSILRYILPTTTTLQRNYVVAPDGDRFIGFNAGSYLVHEFLFSVVSDIVISDSVDIEPSRAFRDFSLIFENMNVPDNVPIMQTLNVSLDDDHTNP